MSIHDRLATLGEELHVTGFGSELTEGVKRIASLLADEIHKLGKGGVDVEALAEKVIASLGEKVDQRIEAKFAELLAKANEAEQPKGESAQPGAPAPQA